MHAHGCQMRNARASAEATRSERLEELQSEIADLRQTLAAAQAKERASAEALRTQTELTAAARKQCDELRKGMLSLSDGTHLTAAAAEQHSSVHNPTADSPSSRSVAAAVLASQVRELEAELQLVKQQAAAEINAFAEQCEVCNRRIVQLEGKVHKLIAYRDKLYSERGSLRYQVSALSFPS